MRANSFERIERIYTHCMANLGIIKYCVYFRQTCIVKKRSPGCTQHFCFHTTSAYNGCFGSRKISGQKSANTQMGRVGRLVGRWPIENTVSVSDCQFHGRTDFVKIGICQNPFLSLYEEIGNSQNRKLSELEIVRIGICQNWKLS